MTSRPSISFAKPGMPKKGSVIVLATEGGALSDAAKACDPGDTFARAFPVADFNGKFTSVVEVLAPQGTQFDRLVALGAGKVDSLDAHAWLKLGGVVASKLRKASEVAVIADIPGVEVKGDAAANLAAGILLRTYSFDKYKTKKDDAEGEQPKTAKPAKITIHCANPAAARKSFADAEAVVDGVTLARDLVN